MQQVVRAIALGRLIAGIDFPHPIMGRSAAVARMRFYAVPLNNQNDPAWIFDTGKTLECFYILLASRRLDCLNRDFIYRALTSTFECALY
jgi:hypothetical protein